MKANRFHLLREESVRSWLERTVTGLIVPLLKRILRAARPGSETIHDIRTTSKRLRALLRLLRPVINPKTFARENDRLRNASRRFASTRDHQVARETLTALIEESGAGHSRELLAHLKKRFPALPGQDPSSAARDAARDLETAGHVLLRMHIAANGWDAIEPGLTETYRRARKRMKKALGHPNAEAFHQWRIPVKHLYYQLQWLEFLWPSEFTSMIKRLHDLEEMLGSDHDLTVIKDVLFPLPDDVAGHHAARVLKKALHKRSRHLRHRAGSLGRKLFRNSAKEFSKRCRRHCRNLLA